MIRLENGLEKRKYHNSLWENRGVLQGELKIEQRPRKWKMCCNSGMAYLT